MSNNNEKLKVFVKREKARLLELMKEFNDNIYKRLDELDSELIRMEKEAISEPIKLGKPERE